MEAESSEETIADIEKELAALQRSMDLHIGKRPPESRAEFDPLARVMTGQAAYRSERLSGERRRVWWIVVSTFVVGGSMTLIWAPSARDALWQLGIGLVGGAVVDTDGV